MARIAVQHRAHDRVPRSVYRRLILQWLLAAPNHEMRAAEIRERMERRLRNRFSAADLETRPNQTTPIWVNDMQWAKKALLMDGMLESVLSSGYGVWRLARHAIARARQEIG